MLLLGSGAVSAVVPVTGRTQQMSFSRADVQAAGAAAYRETLAGMAKRGMLDTRPDLLARVQGIFHRLIGQAVKLKPEAVGWDWEIHVTSDPEVAAYSMSGGKLLVGSGFVKGYALDDGELTVALAHEVAHVIAEHVREQVSMAASLDPPPPNRVETVADVINAMQSDISLFLRLQPLSRLQELEADDIGVELAARAGIAPAVIKRFYAKLTEGEDRQSIFDTHGSSRQRKAFAMSMAEYAGPVYRASREAARRK